MKIRDWITLWRIEGDMLRIDIEEQRALNTRLRRAIKELKRLNSQHA